MKRETHIFKETRGRPAGTPIQPWHKGRNELKRIVLGAMEKQGWLTARTIHMMIGYDRVRPINGTLERYATFGWLKRRGAWNAKPVMYCITNQGKRKLAWLREVMP